MRPQARCASLPITSGLYVPIVDGVLPRTRAAATYCGESSAAPSATAQLGINQPFFYKLVDSLVKKWDPHIRS